MLDALSLALSNAALVAVAVIAVLALSKGVKIVPQSRVYMVERFGRLHQSLQPGLHLIIPFFDRVAHRVSILEQQLDEFRISVITKDNVEIDLIATVFYRITEPEKSVYRIENLERAIYSETASIVRAAGGRQELDEIQSSREEMNQEIERNLKAAVGNWGTEVTRTAIVDVRIDERTKESQRKQLDADRERRAVIAQAEGQKTAIKLQADGELYNAQKSAEAIRVTAEADAHAVRVKADADAHQTQVVGNAIREHGQPAIDFELGKRQIAALGQLAASPSTKTLILPTNVTETLGALASMAEMLGGARLLRGGKPAAGQPAGPKPTGAWPGDA